MATDLQFLTGNVSSILTQKNDSGEYSLAIQPGSVYFTTDSKIYFDLDANTRLCMAEGANQAASAAVADRFSSGRTIALTGVLQGSTESDGYEGWSIKVSYNPNADHPFVLKSGDEITGNLILSGGSDTDSLLTGALNLSNKNITNVNGLYITQHDGTKANQGIHFIQKQGNTEFTHADTLYAKDGNLYFASNRAIDTHQGGGKVLTSNNFDSYAVRTNGSNANSEQGAWAINISGTASLLANAGNDINEWSSKIPGDKKAMAYFADHLNGIDRRSLFLHNENTNQLYGLLITKMDTDTGAPLFSVYDYTNNIIYPLAYTSQLVSSEVAKRWENSIEVNGLSFNGSETISLRTINWGPSVTFKIADATQNNVGYGYETDGSSGEVILTLPSTIKAGLDGIAAKADAFNTNVAIGSSTNPIYIDKFGVPSACGSSLNVDIDGNAATASVASSLINSTFQIGHTYFNYTGQSVNFELANIGAVDTMTTTPQTMNAPLSAPSFKGALEGNAATASLAYTMGTDEGVKYSVGSASIPVYFAEGVPIACSGDQDLNAKTASKWAKDLEVTIGNTAKYLNADKDFNWTYAELTGNTEAVGLVPVVNTLDEDGKTPVVKIPEQYLPSYIDDVREGYYYNNKFYNDAFYSSEMIGVSGIIYVDITNLDDDTQELVSYRWSGSGYVKLASPLSLGHYTGSALDGGEGWSHITNTGNPHEITTAQISALNVITEEIQNVAGQINFNNIISINQKLQFKSSEENIIEIPQNSKLNFLYDNSVNPVLSIHDISLRPGADVAYDLGYAGNTWQHNEAEWTIGWSTIPDPNDNTRRMWNNIFANNIYSNYIYGLSEKATRLANYDLFGEQKSENEDSTKATAGLIYFENGQPQNSIINIGGQYDNEGKITAQPVFIKEGKITPFDCNICEDGISILGLVNGQFTKSTITVGGPNEVEEIADRAIYLKDGVITACADTLMHSITGNAATATILQNSIKINNTDFNGSEDIVTNIWGESREIGIVNSDGSGIAITVGVNGEENINLKLPETIKAELNGNASTASKLKNECDVEITGSVTGNAKFDGSSKLTINTTTNHNHDDRYVLVSGGIAESAAKLTSSAGSNTEPIYFSNGVPVKCTTVFQPKHTTTSVYIYSSDWNSNKTCAKTINGITTSNTVIVAPDPSYHAAYGSAMIRASAQTTNQLTFTCDTIPTATIKVNIIIFN